jgi:hypothetical protein
MNENILKVGKVLESWITLDLSHKGKLDMKPSVSYIESSALSYPPTRNILSSLDGDELVKGLFVAYNLLNGDDDNTALRKAETIYTIDYVQSEGDEYYPDESCEICGGMGEIHCEECDGMGYDDCGNCEGRGNEECGNCDGAGVDEYDDECNYCDGEGNTQCYDCDGDGTIDCNTCNGSGNRECEECEGSGEVEGSIEKIDIEYGTIITQSTEMIEELNRRTDDQREEIIDEFHEWVNRYKNEILITDKIDDTIEWEYEWEVGDAEAKLEGLRMNKLGDYRVGKNNQVTSLGGR